MFLLLSFVFRFLLWGDVFLLFVCCYVGWMLWSQTVCLALIVLCGRLCRIKINKRMSTTYNFNGTHQVCGSGSMTAFL